MTFSDVIISPARWMRAILTESRMRNLAAHRDTGPWRLALRVMSCAVALYFVATAHGQAAMRWYAGDTHVHTAIHAVSSIPKRVEEGIEGGLDWVAITRHVRSGALHKASEVDSAYSRYSPRIAPILGLEWDEPPDLGVEDIVILGVNRYAPIPGENLQDIIDYANREGGVFIFAHPSPYVFENIHKWRDYTAFEGHSGGRWNEACAPGAAWDRLLSDGISMFIVGASDNHNDPFLGDKIVKTYVLAGSNQPADIIAGMRAGRVYVSERNQIQLSFEVNRQQMGGVAPVEGGQVTVSIRAAARTAIRRVELIGNGQRLWSGQPGALQFEMDQTIPVAPTLRYLRLVVESTDATAMSNPVFLSHEGTNGKAVHTPTVEHPLAGARRLAASGTDARQDVQTLLNGWLKGSDPQKRMLGAYGLLDLALPDARPAVRMLAHDSTLAVRRYAARTLAGFAVPGDFDLIRRLIADPDEQVRLWGVRALEASRARKARVTLMDMLEDDAYWVHYAAMEALVDMARADTTLFDELARRVDAGKLGSAEPFRWASPKKRRAVVDRLQARYAKTRTQPLYITLESLGASPAASIKTGVLAADVRPNIDGKLDDPIWTTRPPDLSFQQDDLASGLSTGSRAWIARTADTMYVAVTCASVTATPPPGMVEYVVIGFDTNHNGGIDYTFEIDRSGRVRGQKDGLTVWNAPILARVESLAQGWTAEIAIPFSSVEYAKPVAGQTWGFNVLQGVQGKNALLLAWSPTLGRVSDARRYGAITFGP